MPLELAIHVQRQNGNAQIYIDIKIIPMEQADSVCGFGCLARSSGGRKSSFLLWLFSHF
jgi:hypothetical protein